MKSLIGAAFVASALAIAGPAAISPADATPKAQRAGATDVIDFSAPRRVRRYDRPHTYHRPRYRPHYYDRPVNYRPYPYSVPAPFTFGIAFDPAWW